VKKRKQTRSDDASEKLYGKVKGPYLQKSVKRRIEALFLDNVGRVLKREQIIQVAKDPNTGIEPENWHQRLSELRMLRPAYDC
jgi:hypothetical protein